MLKFTEKRLLYIQESFCISIAIAIGVIIYLVFKIEHGYWIPMTTSIMFLAADQGQGTFIKKTRDRVLGTITGALFGSTLFKRVVCTIIGVSIAIIAEYIIYRRAASIVLSMKKIQMTFLSH